jgi:hypothetical protein
VVPGRTSLPAHQARWGGSPHAYPTAVPCLRHPQPVTPAATPPLIPDALSRRGFLRTAALAGGWSRRGVDRGLRPGRGARVDLRPRPFQRPERTGTGTERGRRAQRPARP